MSLELTYTLVTAAALAVACALLSLVVVWRSWAFIGDGISHAGFGGIGTAWLLSLLIPGLNSNAAVSGVAILFCVAVAMGIGALTRHNRFAGDTAIGIFVVASLAWGVISLAIYQRYGQQPPDWEGYLMGSMEAISGQSVIAALCVAAVVVILLALIKKEILLYCFDPMLATVSGVRSGWIHYLLMLLLAAVVVIGMGLVGNLLVPALLILPGAAALLPSRKLSIVIPLSVGISLAGVTGGCLLGILWPDLPPGALIVLVLICLLALCGAGSAIHRRSATIPAATV